jgi:hypothetical protein
MLIKKMLIKQHPDDQGEGVRFQQSVGGRFLDKLQFRHGLSLELSGELGLAASVHSQLASAAATLRDRAS